MTSEQIEQLLYIYEKTKALDEAITLVRLGTGTTGSTLDVSAYPGYENFDKNNFIVLFSGPTSKSTSFANGGASNGAYKGTLYTYTNLETSYNNTTGIFNINKCNSVASFSITTYGSGGTTSAYGTSWSVTNNIFAEIYLVY